MNPYNDPLVWPEEGEPEEPTGDIEILDDSDLDRLLRWRKDRIERITAVEERAKKMRHDIDEWEASTTDADRRAVEDLERSIRNYLTATGKTNFHSPFGKVTSRRGSARLTVEEGARIEAVARILEGAGHDDLVERRVRIADAKRTLAPSHELDPDTPDEANAVDPTTGQIIPGLVFKSGGRTWTIK